MEDAIDLDNPSTYCRMLESGARQFNRDLRKFEALLINATGREPGEDQDRFVHNAKGRLKILARTLSKLQENVGYLEECTEKFTEKLSQR